MRLLTGLWGLAALAMATVAHAAPNVNLSCAGMETFAQQGTPTKKQKFSDIYRIDYENSRWCYGKCEIILPISSVTDEAIVLMYTGNSGVRVDRVKGTLAAYYSVGAGDGTTLNQFIDATCTPQPFTEVERPPAGPPPVPKF